MKLKLGGRELGGIVVLVSVLMAFFVVSYVNTLIDLTQESCTCGDTCGMKQYETPPIVYAGIVGVSLIFFVGVYLMIKGGNLNEGGDRKEEWGKILGTLEVDEKSIYQQLVDENGAIFQSELVEKSGLSKVKVSRTLDKLEAKGHLERRRRGLTNIIVLK